MFGPDGLTVRGLAGPPALGEPGYKEQAASVLVQGTGPAEVRGGAAAVRDLADERSVADKPELDRALRVPDRGGDQLMVGGCQMPFVKGRRVDLRKIVSARGG